MAELRYLAIQDVNPTVTIFSHPRDFAKNQLLGPIESADRQIFV
jgi:hypothetical protein